jgi:phosphosulfolactate synthase
MEATALILADQTAFSGLLRQPISGRHVKPRVQGITMAIDKGLGYHELRDILDINAPYLDVVKFGFGSSCLYTAQLLRHKLSLLRIYSVHSCPGGTLAEIAILQNCFEDYVKLCRKLGFTALEISDGTIELEPDARRKAIATAKKTMQQVISEVGKKNGEHLEAEKCKEQIISDLSAGADYVIVEGREGGENAGIYDPDGAIDTELLEEITRILPKTALNKIIWEAPQKNQQVEFIRRFGNNVNFGNIPPREVLAVESLRQGLRSDTLQFSQPQKD